MTTYDLNFSFTTTADATISVLLKDNSGASLGAATVASSFADDVWYGYTITIDSGFQGFISFSDGVSTVAQFAINPSEFETLPLQGVGGVAYTLRVVDSNGRSIEGAGVWITEDQEGLILKGGTLYSNDIGKVTFTLAPGNYYVWRRHPGFTFNNPNLITVAAPS